MKLTKSKTIAVCTSALGHCVEDDVSALIVGLCDVVFIESFVSVGAVETGSLATVVGVGLGSPPISVSVV